jgi:hypothetical protein
VLELVPNSLKKLSRQTARSCSGHRTIRHGESSTDAEGAFLDFRPEKALLRQIRNSACNSMLVLDLRCARAAQGF